MSLLPKNPAQRLYVLRLATAMTAYLLLLLLAKHTLEHHHFSQPLTWIIAVLPALPIVAVLAGVGLYLAEEKDEFERTITMQCMLCGIAATLAADSVWGFLEIFAAAPHVAPYLNFCVFWFFAGIANPLVRGRYR